MGHGIYVYFKNGQRTRVDAEDADWLDEFNYWICPKKCGDYVQRSVMYHGHAIMIPLARDILGCYDPNLIVDHINGDTMDNRKSNLRIATRAQNRVNSKKVAEATSKYKGVAARYGKKGTRYEAYAYEDGTKIHLGMFDDEDKAARAANREMKRIWGEFARLNVIHRKPKQDVPESDRGRR